MQANLFELLLKEFQQLFNVRSSVNGNIDLQKSFYFMKELGRRVPFNFRWSKFGPYSYELANFVDQLVMNGYLRYSGKYLPNDRAFNHPFSDDKDLKNFFRILEQKCDHFDFEKVDFIECAASLHFLYKYSNIGSKKEVFNRFDKLKSGKSPTSNSLKEEVWNFLKEQGLID